MYVIFLYVSFRPKCDVSVSPSVSSAFSICCLFILFALLVYSVCQVPRLLHHLTVCTVLLWRLSLPHCLLEKYLLVYCTRRIKCFLIPLSGLLIFLVMSISFMWHVVPWGNRALAPTARQTKCVCLRSSASLLCVCRDDRESVWLFHFVLLAVFFSRFYFFPVMWPSIIFMPLWGETGGLSLLLVVSHTKAEAYCRSRQIMLLSSVFRAFSPI